MNYQEVFIKKIWPKVCDYLNDYGPYKYSGYIGGKEQGWAGPYLWSENGDVVRLITKYCEDEFEFDCVHNESKVDKCRFDNFKFEDDSSDNLKSYFFHDGVIFVEHEGRMGLLFNPLMTK